MKGRQILYFCLILFLSSGGQALAFDLQHEIDQASEGEVISIPAGEYEGPIRIHKPLILQSHHDAVLVNQSNETALVIETDEAEIHGMTVHHQNNQLDLAAVSVTGDHNKLIDLKIQTGGMGVVLADADHNHLHHVTIEGGMQDRTASGSMSAREGNGIDLFRAHDNVIEQARVKWVQDGVYIERSRGNIVRGSIVSDSRYGVHLMFSEQTQLVDNESFGNITGAMIMGTQGTVVKNNYFYEQSKHVFSQGLMLYDVQGATVTQNVIAQNLVGLSIESAYDNIITGNDVRDNYIGLDVTSSENNTLEHNEFMGNMISARATKSQENTIRHNYWEEHNGLDTTGDRVSELPFAADLMYPAIMNSKSIYQIFADSPGLMFLQLVLDIDHTEALVDSAPSMERNGKNEQETKGRQQTNPKAARIIYSLTFMISMFGIIKIGGRRKWGK